jgi:hypothetical protein
MDSLLRVPPILDPELLKNDGFGSGGKFFFGLLRKISPKIG